MNTQQSNIPQEDRVLRPREAMRYLSIGHSTLYDLIDRGLLEPPSPIGVRAVGWRMSQLNAYLERRAAEHKAVIAARAARRAEKRRER